MGDVNKRNERLGLTNVNKQEYLMKVVEYNNNNNIIVEFQDEEHTRVKSTWNKFKNGNIENPYMYKQRLGMIKENNQGYLMKVVKYDGVRNVVVEFQDEYKERVCCIWKQFQNGSVTNPIVKKLRLGEKKLNKQNDLMIIVEYNNAHDIIIEFQDKYKAKIKTTYENFTKGNILNPYHPTIYGVGMKGLKYPASYINKNGRTVGTKEYYAFRSMIARCYSVNLNKRQPSYKEVTCCEEWHNRDNFEDWLRSQPNYMKFLENDFALDKDILVHGNKIYSPETCCLVPRKINELFKNDADKSNGMPTGVKKHKNKYLVYCCINGKNTYIDTCNTKIEAAITYKNFKENHIKQIAKLEYFKGNITEQCYNAMMNYQVEIINCDDEDKK